MPVKVAINGYGRIGRNVLRALYEGNRRAELEVVAEIVDGDYFERTSDAPRLGSR